MLSDLLAVYGLVVPAREVTFRSLNLDHAGTGVGQAARTPRRSYGLFQRYDKDAIKGFGGHGVCFIRNS